MSIKLISLTLFAVVSLTACNIFESGSPEIIEELYDLENIQKAVLFVKHGNAVTNSSFHVSIVKANYSMKDSDIGNIFISETIENSELSRKEIIAINWLDMMNLQIFHSTNLRIFKKQITYNNSNHEIAIKYVTKK